MDTIEAVLRDVPLFEGLTPAQLELIAGCGSNVQFRRGRAALPRRRPGRHLLRAAPRERRARDVRPGTGFGRHRDARSGRSGGLVVALPAVPMALRRPRRLPGASDQLRRRLPARQVRHRPEARVRPDLALRPGHDRAASSGRGCGSSTCTAMAIAAEARPAVGPMVPLPFRVTKRRRELADTWTLELEPVGGERVAACSRAVHDALRVRDRRGADLGVGRRLGAARPHGARSRRRLARDLRLRAGRRARRPRAVRQRLARRGGRRQRRRRRGGRNRPRPAPAGRVRRSGPACGVRRCGAPLRQPDTHRPPLPDGARAPSGPLRPPRRRHGRRGRERLARQGRSRAEAHRRGALRPGRRRSRSSAGRRS